MSCFQISAGSLGGQHHSTCYYIEVLAVLGVLFDLCFPVLLLQTFCLLSGPHHASVDTLLFGLLFLGCGSVPHRGLMLGVLGVSLVSEDAPIYFSFCSSYWKISIELSSCRLILAPA